MGTLKFKQPMHLESVTTPQWMRSPGSSKISDPLLFATLTRTPPIGETVFFHMEFNPLGIQADADTCVVPGQGPGYGSIAYHFAEPTCSWPCCNLVRAYMAKVDAIQDVITSGAEAPES